MSSLTRTPRRALDQLSARRTLPVPSQIAIGLAHLYLVWWHRHTSRQHLARLDNHMLRDIGLTAKDARHECSKWFWRP